MAKLIKIIPILLVALVLMVEGLSGCSAPTLAPLKSDGVILAFGDSLTVGVGTTKSNSYPSVLAELSGLRVINSGISGETSDRGRKRLVVELDRVSPDLLILIEGGNDILRNRRYADIKKDLKGMVELAKNRGIPVVLIGVPEKSLLSSSAPFYEELADQYELVFDGVLLGSLQRSPKLKSDVIHFNQKGYRKMAEGIYALLQNSGAL